MLPRSFHLHIKVAAITPQNPNPAFVLARANLHLAKPFWTKHVGRSQRNSEKYQADHSKALHQSVLQN